MSRTLAALALLCLLASPASAGQDAGVSPTNSTLITLYQLAPLDTIEPTTVSTVVAASNTG